MEYIQETTNELLNVYNKQKNNKSIDDLTIYSDNDFSFNYDNILENSIELGRSVESPLKMSPFKKYGISPLKQPINNYQNQVLKMRSGTRSNSNSPLKKKSKPKKDTFSIADILNESTFDNDIINSLDKKMKPIKSEKKIFDLEDEDIDGTELIIKETHNLISKIPDSMTSNKESEDYIEILSSSIKKLTKQLESIKIENKKLKSENNMVHKTKLMLESLEEKNITLVKENHELKNQLNQVQRKVRQRIPQENSHLNRENNLLRDKLKKYKTLYDDSKKENEDRKKSGNISEENNISEDVNDKENYDERHKKIVSLLNSIASILHKPKPSFDYTPSVKEKVTSENENSNLKLLSMFEDIAQTMRKELGEREDNSRDPRMSFGQMKDSSKPTPFFATYPDSDAPERESVRQQEESYYYTPPKQSSPKGSSEGSINVKTSNTSSYSNKQKLDENILQKLLQTMETNNDLQLKMVHLLSEDKNEIRNYLNQKDKSDRDVVFKCYMCCPQSNKEDAPKKACEKCSSVLDEKLTNANPDESRTVNLMGEYKWTI